MEVPGQFQVGFCVIQHKVVMSCTSNAPILSLQLVSCHIGPQHFLYRSYWGHVLGTAPTR